MRLSWEQAAAWRARRQHLDRRAPAGSMLAVTAELGGVHAQVMSSAELSLWARVDGLQRDAVAKALWQRRTLVKTWAMRGTLHLLPASEYRLWQAALSRYKHFLRPSWLRAFGLNDGELEQLLDAVTEVLSGRLLTRNELADAVSELTGSPDLGDKLRHSWGALLKPASYRGLLCFGPNAGQNVRFARPDEWLGRTLGAPVDPEEAALTVTRRFLAAYGPATRADYGHWWGGMSPAQAGRLIAALGDEVTSVHVEGEPAWLLSANVEAAAATRPLRSVRLLPAFDQYVIEASPHAERLLPAPDLRGRIFRPQGWLTPVLLVGGQMQGVWRHERRGGRVVVEIEPFVPLASWARRAVDEEAERLADYMDATLDVSITAAR